MRRYSLMLGIVALLWGASFLFIKVAVRELQPATLILARLGLATVALAAIVFVRVGGRETLGQLRGHAGWLVAVGVVNVAVPFALAVPLTAIAFLLFYAIIAGPGAAYASLVTYLVPPIALAYGAIFLHERFGPSAFAALVLIFVGVVLGTGRVRLRRPVASRA